MVITIYIVAQLSMPSPLHRPDMHCGSADSATSYRRDNDSPPKNVKFDGVQIHFHAILGLKTGRDSR